MIEYKHHSNSKFVEVSIEGEVSAEESDKVALQLESDIEQYGKLRILQEFRNSEAADPSNFWKDARFALDHDHGLSHVALVTDADWLMDMVKSTGHTLAAEVRVFKRSQIEEARTWLRDT